MSLYGDSYEHYEEDTGSSSHQHAFEAYDQDNQPFEGDTYEYPSAIQAPPPKMKFVQMEDGTIVHVRNALEKQAEVMMRRNGIPSRSVMLNRNTSNPRPVHPNRSVQPSRQVQPNRHDQPDHYDRSEFHDQPHLHDHPSTRPTPIPTPPAALQSSPNVAYIQSHGTPQMPSPVSSARPMTPADHLLQDVLARIAQLEFTCETQEARLQAAETQLTTAHAQIDLLTTKLSNYRTARGSPAMKPYFAELPPFNTSRLNNWEHRMLEFDLEVPGYDVRHVVIDFAALATREFLNGKTPIEVKKPFSRGILEVIGNDEYNSKLSASDDPRQLTRIPQVLLGHAAWSLYIGFHAEVVTLEVAQADENWKHYADLVQLGLQDLLINVRRRRRETHASNA